MRILFSCGGTGGHINPAIAAAKICREKKPGCQILFVGAGEGLESDLVPKAGFDIETVEISNFIRSITPKAIVHNIRSVFLVGKSRRQADRILDRFKPDVVVGTGGYASYPVVSRAAKRGIPTAIHESNALPGLTTRSLADKVDIIMVGVEDSRDKYPKPEKVRHTGTPVREEMLFVEKAWAREKLEISDSKPLVVSFWGSLGAREMNKKMAQFIKLESGKGDFHHIHATGSYGWKWMPDLIGESGVNLEKEPFIRMTEYIYDMPTVMGAADLIICRAGAGTLCEVAAVGVPAVIVPSPNVAENHQEKNALVFRDRGACEMVLESDCTGESLYHLTERLLADPARLREMSTVLSSLAVLDSTERIYACIMELYKGR